MSLGVDKAAWFRLIVSSACLVCVLLWFGCARAGAADLVPPQGYTRAAAANTKPRAQFDCPSMPAPFLGPLDFPSKYAAGDVAHATIDRVAEARYKALTDSLSELEKGITHSVDKYASTADPAALSCAVTWYAGWASVQALLGDARTHTGRAARKWTLSALSGAYLRLKFSASKPLDNYPSEARGIETWLLQLAERVVQEWPLSDPIRQINNHYYWAAWSVMATAVITDRRDLFDWSVRMVRIFERQVDSAGYLPNELARKSRALQYNNYALTPVAMIAAFAKANGLALADEQGGALKRAARRVLQGVEDPRVFQRITATSQNLEGLKPYDKQLAWLEPYCWTVKCEPAVAKKVSELRPFKNRRLGGDMSAVFVN